MKKLTHRERIQACIKNSSSLDRPPVALWRHFPVDDQSPGSLATAIISFQNHFDFDLVKITPASSFCLKDWGAEDIWEGSTEGTRRFTKSVIEKPKDWESLKILNPKKSRFLSEQLNCITMIRASVHPDTPVIQTIFSPLAQAKNLVGKDKLIFHLQNYPESVHRGLSIIAETTNRLIEAVIDTKIDGIFFAIQHAQKSELTRDEFLTFGIAHDMHALSSLMALPYNMLHIHGDNIYFDIYPKYSPFFQITNWHDRETPPSLTNGLNLIKGSACGGVSQKTIVYGNQSQVNTEIKCAFDQTSKQRLILGTGCVVPIIAPYGNILAVRKSVDNQE